MSRRALVCGYGPPRHDRDSGSRRLSHFVSFLGLDDWDVTFLSASRIREPHYARQLLRDGVAVYDAEVDPVADMIRAGRFDLVVCAFWQIAELYLPLVRELSPSAAVVVDSVDVQFVRDARRLLGRRDGRKRAWPLDTEYGLETAAELNVYAAADAVLTVSKTEADLISGLLDDRELCHVVPDAEDLRRSPVTFENRRGILFLGSFRHPPNLDALSYFSRDIAPLLERSLLESHPFTVVGDGLDDTGKELALDVPHARAIGWVPSLEPYLEGCRITIVPLRYGAGTKRKLIQALMTGTPTVATSIGVEGLDLRPRADVLVADDAHSFARSVEELLRSEGLWQRLSRNGRARVARTHTTAAVGDRFRAAVESALTRPRKAPLLPRISRDVYEQRTMSQEHQKLTATMDRIFRESVPEGATLYVVSGGSAELLRLASWSTHHFPPGGRDDEVGGNPPDTEAAISIIDDAVARGADFLFIPSTFDWWLTYYAGLKEHLESRYRVQYENGCALCDLRSATDSVPEGVEKPHESPARLIAFYLPQFHPIPENDAWWGEGFTEWTNVAKAEPLFQGHYQPHLPADLGFYDLREPSVREAQAELARQAGISGFCYYHYWFHGTRLLERPFDEVLSSGEPDFPFCLCWANEPWSRRWDGREEDVLQAQTYSQEDDLEHIHWLLPALRDERALTVEGKPLFVVYQARDLPDPARTTDLWRREVRKAGLPGLCLLTVETGWDAGWDATEAGFDGKILFQPQFSILNTVPRLEAGSQNLRVFAYDEAWPILSRPDPVRYRRYETVCAGWDNSPRRGVDGWLLHDSTPDAYGQWLSEAVDRVQDQAPEQRLVFLNAWNEWAEGAHLEPDQRHGLAYLDATRRALDEAAATRRPAGAPATATEDRAHVREEAIALAPPRARAFAFYLPQFHPIPENDEWWGRGFTEWTNVARARPHFPGHYQPHLPANLGFYDLRVPEARERQAALAAGHGIEGFCYWHYWFHGKRLLERPFSEVRESGRPDFPFCLAWANETWSRRWLGEERDILMKQEYSPEDDLEHIHWLLPTLADRRCARVDDRPLFLVYRPIDLPEPQRTTELWRSVCVREGLPEPYLLGINSHRDLDYRSLGFDGTLDFEPQLGAVVDPLTDGLKVVDYAQARRQMRRRRSFPVYPSVVVGWDNTPRRGEHGVVFADATPEEFERGLWEAVGRVGERPFDDRLVFINAWNEWAEGNHLEPDRRYGLRHLEAVHRVVLEPAGPEIADPAPTTPSTAMQRG
jgi:lipopolysaccharide biosynthesis protein/glycosyltransferase involved in cell wall biosynthesis